MHDLRVRDAGGVLEGLVGAVSLAQGRLHVLTNGDGAAAARAAGTGGAQHLSDGPRAGQGARAQVGVADDEAVAHDHAGKATLTGMSPDTVPTSPGGAGLLTARRRVLVLQLETLRSRAGHQHVDRARALRAELRRLDRVRTSR
jgi:hypothetical protein